MCEQSKREKILSTIKEAADSDYIFVYDFQARVVHWTEEAVKYFGFSAKEIQHFFFELQGRVHPDDKEKCSEELSRVLELKQESFYKSYHMLNAEGEYILCRGKGKIYRDEDGVPQVFAGTLSVCNEEVTYDSVSGLQTVNGFIKNVERYHEEDEDYMVLAAVLHHFHEVNSMSGYDFGNKVLYKFSNMFRDWIHDRGYVYRIEGTVFIFVIKNRDVEFAKELYEKIRWTAEHFKIDGYTFNMEVIGALWCVNEKYDPNQMLSVLSAVVDRAKMEEKYDLIIYDDERHVENSKATELINTIKTSILNDCEGFYLCYQPFVSTITGKVIGAEALIRWRSEEYGNVSPYRFIPYIESHPCFYDLGLWIIRQAISDAKKIREISPDFFININMSYSQLQKTGFKESVIAILDDLNYPREGLQLELTERCWNLDLKFLQEQLQFFRENNIRIALDDFGTGTATIELLCNLPIDCVKIDQTFILNILEKDNNQVIVDTTMQCTRKLGIDVCLEGVENQEIKSFVEQYSANYHQGYFYSKPVEYDEFVSYLDRSWSTNRINVIKGDGKANFDVNNILSMIPGGFFIYINDEEERITCANEALLRMLECENAEDFYELTGNTFKGLVHPEDYPDVEDSIRKQIARSAVQMDYVKYRITTKSGKVKWVHDYGHLVSNEHDKDVFYVFLGDMQAGE